MPHFLHLTLQKAAAVNDAAVGSFTAARQHEIVAAHGKSLALYRVSDEGKLVELYNEECFGLARRVVAFRLTGGTRDHLAVTSDSGRIALLDWDASSRKFVKLHRETYGKTGVRRVVAGEYIAVEPKGRALMIAAVEKQKFVYILSRDAAGRMAIGSPLEVHKSYQICFDLCALNVGFENPVFVSLEVNYENSDSPQLPNSKSPKAPSKQLAFWELDLGLNHVVKKCSLNCDRTASAIIPIPAGAEFSEGPGGVLVCCENCIQFKKPDHPEIVCAIPRRLEMEPDKGLLVSCWTAHRMKDFHFVLFQTEYGDLYRVDVISDGPTVSEIVIKYFDSIPVATSLCIVKNGFLFAASEMGDHNVYQFTGVGMDENQYLCSSKHPDGKAAVVPIKPRKLKHLLVASTWQSMGPMTDLKVIDCIGDTHTPQIYALTGTGPRSHLNIMRQGLRVEEMAASEVPGYPTGLWTFSECYNDHHHRFIFLSFSSATLILKISDAIEELAESMFVTDRSTLHAACMADDSHLQVTEEGWRMLQRVSFDGDNLDRKVVEWRAPAGKRVLCAASNASQLLLSVSGGLLVYFELSQTGNRLLEETATNDLGHEVSCLAIQPTPASSLRSYFAAVGGIDRSVRMLTLEKDKVLLRQVAVHMLPAGAHAESLAICRLPFTQTEASDEAHFGTTLCVGLSTGVLLRISVDPNSGQLQQNRRQKFLGASPVKVVPVAVQVPAAVTATSEDTESTTVVNGCLALSSKSWLAYSHQGYFRLASLVYDSMNYAATLNSVHCQAGYVVISGNVLKIISVHIDPQDNLFSNVRIPLQYTPRKATVFPPPPTMQERQEAKVKGMPIMLMPPSAQRPWLLATIECDHNAFDLITKEQITKALKEVQIGTQALQDAPNTAAADGQNGLEDSTTATHQSGQEVTSHSVKNEDISLVQESHNVDEEAAEEGNQYPPETQTGTFQAGDAKWGGILRLINPFPAAIVQSIPFGPDEAPTSITVCQFLEYPQHPALVVGTVTALNLKDKSCQGGSLKVYVYNDEGLLTLHHETPLEDVPLAVCPWSGQLLAAVGHRIRIYTLGKKRLLKRCEYKNLPTGINWLRVSGERIFASDIQAGFHVLKYSPMENVLQVVGEMTVPRWVTCGEVLDPYTIIGGDKFDNLFVVRLPSGSVKDSELYDTTGLKVRGDTAYLTGLCHKMDRLNEFHIGDMPVAMQKCLLAPGGAEIVLCGTIMGSISVLLPLQTQKEVELLQHLEMLLRNEDVSPIGRDHIFFRSAFFPVKDVIDADLLEVFPKLKDDRQKWIAQQLDKTPSDILRILDDLRSRMI